MSQVPGDLRPNEPAQPSLANENDIVKVSSTTQSAIRIFLEKEDIKASKVSVASEKNWFKKVKVTNSTGETYNLNISSLSKKTGLSIFRIILKSIFGGITLEFISDKILEKQGEGAFLASEIKEQVEIATQGDVEKLKVFCNKIGAATNKTFQFLGKKGEQYIIHNKDIYRIEKSLGFGSFGTVHKVYHILNNKENFAVKRSRGEDFLSGDSSREQIENEYNILNEIKNRCTETDTPFEGIQEPPSAILYFENEQRGYLTRPFDFDLNKIPEEEKSSALEPSPHSLADRIAKSKYLLVGLRIIHAAGIVHQDIKPENCCSENGQYRLADFGGVKKQENIALGIPASSLNYLSDMDAKNYFDLDDASIQIETIMRKRREPEGSVNEMAAEESQEKISKYTKKYFDQELSNKYPDVESYLKEEAMEVARKHDVYSLGVTLAKIFGNAMVPKIVIERFQSNDTFVTKIDTALREQGKVNLAELITKMTDLDPEKRPTAEEALAAYEAP